jgi:transcriptional repressor NrdR
MRCPFCGSDDTQVKDSRPSDDGSAIRRRRFCPACGARFTTFERVQLRDLMVIKNAGDKQPFEREKLARSMRIALRKRPVAEERLERAVNSVVRQLEALGENDITTKQIGAIVMEALQALDHVAYVRYASVYRDFRTPEDFNAFVNSLASAEQA